MAGAVTGFGKGLAPGTPSNVIIPQTGHGHNPSNTGPQRIPQAPGPIPTMGPLSLPWAQPSSGLGPR
jgi:hypothetical protein